MNRMPSNPLPPIESTSPIPWRRIDIAVMGVFTLWAIAQFIAACRGYWAFTVDDAYITLRQARNLVEGHGFVYNPGGPRVESYTNHLLFLWQAAVLSLGGHGLFWTKILGALSGIATLAGSLFVGWVVVERLRPADSHRLPLSGLAAAPLFLARDPMLFTGAVSGLETALFTALVTWGGGLSLLLLTDSPRRATAIASALLLGLATWTRPEGIAWLVGFSIALALARRLSGQTPRPVLLMAALGLSLWLLLLLWRLTVFGHPWPNTYYAKMGTPMLSRMRGGWGYVADFLFFNGGLWLFLAMALGLSGPGRQRRWGVITALAATMAGTLLAWFEGGDWIPHLRLIAPISGLLAGGACAGIVLAATRIPRAGAALAVALPFLAWQAHDAATRPALRAAWAEIQTRVYGWNDAHRPLAIWLGEWNARRLADDRERLAVAIEDIGLVGWYGDVRIYDLAGLADPVWAHMHYRDPQSEYPADLLLNERRPEVVVIVSQTGRHEPELRIEWRTNRAVYEHPDFKPNFTEVAMFTHKDFPGDGLFLHVFARNDLLGEVPAVTPPKPRAVDGG